MVNQLTSASSLYLQQHAAQPVHWQEWSAEVLERAAAEGKWLLVSIGYSTCHWCHVMAHEVFDDPEVAAVLNERWISIKVDREERPDLDHSYMAASLAMTGQGGWPLNAICLPDGRPVWIATYLPKARFLSALEQLDRVRRTHGLQALDYADQIAEFLGSSTDLGSRDELEWTAVKSAMSGSWDAFWGGFRGAPKFPLSASWSALWRLGAHRPWPEALSQVDRTLATLIRSGTYDLGRGGLFRYSTDGAWVVPHFEKMLYDSALFARLCAEVGSAESLVALEETLTFLERDLLRDDHLFAAGLDADHPDGEGRTYTWTESELREALGSDAPGWLEMLERESRLHDGAWNLACGPADGPNPRDLAGFEALRSAALARPLPLRDPKCVLSWNALAVCAVADAVLRTGSLPRRSLLIALASAHRRAFADGQVAVHYPDGRSSGPAFLDAMAYSIQMAVRCSQVLLDPAWLDQAIDWLEIVRTRFERAGRMHFAPQNLRGGAFADTLTWDDDVLPNPLQSLAESALIVGHLRALTHCIEWSKHLIKLGLDRAATNPARHASWIALDLVAQDGAEHWLIRPHAVLGARSLPATPLWGPMEREATVFAQLCGHDACRFAARTETEFNHGPNPFN